MSQVVYLRHFVTTVINQEYVCCRQHKVYFVSAFPKRGRGWGIYFILLDSNMSLAIVCLDLKIFGATGVVVESVRNYPVKCPGMCSRV